MFMIAVTAMVYPAVQYDFDTSQYQQEYIFHFPPSLQVRTGSVLSRKISLLTRAGSLEPEIDFTESPAPKRRTVRFAGLDSPSPTMPTGRRPKVSLLLEKK